MSTQQRDGQTLTQIHPHVRRGRPPAQRPEPEPPPPQPIALSSDEYDDDEDGLYHHPPHSYSMPSRVRWTPSICLLEEIEPSRVQAWDAREDEYEIVQWRMIVQRHEGVRHGKYDTVVDQTRSVNPGPEGGPDVRFPDITREYIRDTYGAGTYRVMCYAFYADPQSGVVVTLAKPRQFMFSVRARMNGAAAPGPVAIVPQAVESKDPPRDIPRGPSSMLASALGSLQPSNISEAIQLLQATTQIEAMRREAEDRAEERRMRMQREEDDRRMRDEDRRIERQRLADERRDREIERLERQRQLDEERKEKEEERRERRAANLETRLLEMKTAQLSATAGSPLEQMRQSLASIKEAQELFGGGEGGGGRASSIIQTIMESAEPFIPAIQEVAKEIISDRAKLAELEVRMNAQIAHQQQMLYAQRLAAAPRAASPAPQPAPAPVPPPPQPAAVALPAVLPVGSPCPACGSADGCEHFPADDEIDLSSSEECDKCEPCPHGEEDEDENGDCKLCPPCPHGDDTAAALSAPVPLVPPNLATVPESVSLPPLGAGFQGLTQGVPQGTP